MADADLVDGDGWISDESDFYGDGESSQQRDVKAERKLKRSFYQSQPQAPHKRQKADVGPEEENRHQRDSASTASPSPDASQPAAPTPVFTAKATEVVDREKHSTSAATWQQGEPILDFIRRLPVQDPKTAQVGPWLWVHNPTASNTQTAPEAYDVGKFLEAASELQEAFQKRRISVEAELSGKAQATITRRMGPHREQLERDILDSAIRFKITCGKWMLFPNRENLPRFWRLVAEATSQGKLGPCSKVATYDHNSKKEETLVCVYTYDFTDVDDVRRVLDEVSQHGENLRGGKPIYYKCDAYTYLGIQSDNSFKIRASLFSSKEMFSSDAKFRWTV